MKKLIVLVSMIACILGLTACSEAKLGEYEQSKVDYASQLAVQQIVPFFASLTGDEAASSFDGYSAEEVEYMVGNQYQLNVEGNAVTGGISSFNAAAELVGNIINVENPVAVIDGHQIIVKVDVIGEKRAAEAEIIFSNDMFMVLESAALNPSYSLGEIMGKAGLNTLIGMGTVFAVLILISFIISLFKFVPVIQAKFTKQEAAASQTKAADTVTTAPAAVLAEAEAEADETDDTELVAVIAAAIAASKGAQTTEGFVVRSIRKVNRSRAY